MFVLFSSISSIAGNRTQANYAVGNSFQNSLARYRKETLGLPAISIALGAMSTVGVLANDPNLLQALSRSGLCPYDLDDFERILEAAILASYSRDRSLICTGLQRFQCLDSTIKCEDHQNQIFWSHWPEFGFLFDYDRNDMSLTKAKTLLESLEEATEVEASSKLFNAFSRCIADTLGRPAEEFDPDMSITSCGLDSLNTIACRYWLFKGCKAGSSFYYRSLICKQNYTSMSMSSRFLRAALCDTFYHEYCNGPRPTQFPAFLMTSWNRTI